METSSKRTKEEVRSAFREFMRKKKEHREKAVAELEQLSLQGFFEANVSVQSDLQSDCSEYKHL